MVSKDRAAAHVESVPSDSSRPAERQEERQGDEIPPKASIIGGTSARGALPGDWDYVLTVVAKATEDGQRVLLNRLAKISGVANYKSTLVVRAVKRSIELPV